MFTTRSFSLGLVSTLSLFLLISSGCSGRAASAQKLFDKGDYQAVISKYSDLEVARRAHAKLAEQLLQKKDYSEVLHHYGDTPSAYQARLEMAQQLFDQGRYQAILDSFPQSPLAATAKGKIADSLVAAGDNDKVLNMFADTPQARTIKEARAKAEFARIKKLPKKDRASALEDFMKKYSGTEPYKDASTMLSDIRQAESKQANKK